MMLLLGLLVCFLQATYAASASCKCGTSSVSRIVGGSNAPKGKYPWMAFSYKTTKKSYCGGSIITDRHILTAAHCADHLEPHQLQVHVGSNIIQSGQLVTVKKIHVHERYYNFYRNDIAIIELAKPLQFAPNIQPICLPDKNMTNYEKLTALGWGRTNPEKMSPSHELQELSIENVPLAKCKKSVMVDYWHICAGAPSKGVCQGDSGGPLVHYENGRAFVVGIASFVPKGCITKNVGVFTRVTEYLDWIEEHTQGGSYCRQ